MITQLFLQDGIVFLCLVEATKVTFMCGPPYPNHLLASILIITATQGNSFNDQGKKWSASRDDYMTDLIQERALAFIREQIHKDQQFFAYIAPHAPHTRATPPNYAQVGNKIVLITHMYIL